MDGQKPNPNLELYDKVRSVPDTAKKTISGGRMNGKTDINPMWRIKTLTEQFGPCGIGWYYTPVRKWIETHGDEMAAFVDIELFVKSGSEWSKPISGTGGSMFATKEKSGIFVSDECYKMATTDAISVACKQLGIGADVYWDRDNTKYDKPGQEAPKLINADQKKIFAEECERIGKSQKAVLSVLKVRNLEEMTVDQFNNAMEGFKNTPSKPMKKPDPKTVPPDKPDDSVPWNTQAR